MKRDDVKKLIEKPDGELKELVKTPREELRVLRFDLDAGKVKNVAALRETKKKIARALTALRMRETKHAIQKPQ